MNIEQISAITLKVKDMNRSLQFYHDVLRLDIKYQSPAFSTLMKKGTVLNLEKGNPENHWGRIIFYVEDVDKLWEYLKVKRIKLGEAPKDASWNERYFHINDPDGHEISFAKKS